MINISKYYLAVDIGASSGRHILGSIVNGKIEIEEIYRFENGMINSDGDKVWDLKYLFNEILNGMKKCKELNKEIVSMSIDTWAVDYVLLDENDEILGKTYGYRDDRTKNMDKEVYKYITEEKLYERTGIQKKIFNTIYQLMADKEKGILDKAKTFMMLPDYFNFLLTGVKKSEYTNATSTQLVDTYTKLWDKHLIDLIGLNKEMFLPLDVPGKKVGNLKKEIREKVLFDCEVKMIASHDTASAIAALPSNDEDIIYLSSGTWSLMGIESENPIITRESREFNFTNEGGYNYKFRFLKNIMGLWIIQQVRHEYEDKYSFKEMCDMAEKVDDFPSRIDVNDECFLAPSSMVKAIQDFCKKSNQKVPENIGEISLVIYKSLAKSYAETVKEIEKITNKKYTKIHILGGGANAEYLNRLTAKETKKTVHAGVIEATAIGNLVVQMISDKKIESLESAREIIFNSFKIKKY